MAPDVEYPGIALKELPPKLPTLARRMLGVMADLPYIQKKKEIDLGGRRIKTLSYEDLAGDVQPLLVKHGILVMSSLHDLKIEVQESEKPGYRADDPPKKVVTTIATVQMDFTFINADDQNDRFVVRFPGMGFDTSDKAVGKATTYAAKDCLRKVFVVPSGEEPEDDNHDRPAPPKKAEKAPPKAQDSESVREAWEEEAVANLSSAVTLEALAAVWGNYKNKSPAMIAAKDKRKAELVAAKSSPPEPLPTKGTPIDPNTVGALEDPPPPKSGLMGRVPPKILALIERSAPLSPPEAMEVAKAMLPLLGSERWAAEVKANGGDVAKTYFGLAGHDLNMLVAKLVDVASGDK